MTENEITAESAEDIFSGVTDDRPETFDVTSAKQKDAKEVEVRSTVMKQFESTEHSVPSQPDWIEVLISLLIALTLLIPGLRIGRGRKWSAADRLSIQRSHNGSHNAERIIQ